MPRASGPDLPRRRVVPVAVGSAVLAIAAVAVALTATAVGSPQDAVGAIAGPAGQVVVPSPTWKVEVIDRPVGAPLQVGSADTAQAPEPR